ncbi:MAG: hypothetical protein AB7N76_05125 [Planctomycetota bacterium]
MEEDVPLRSLGPGDLLVVHNYRFPNTGIVEPKKYLVVLEAPRHGATSGKISRRAPEDYGFVVASFTTQNTPPMFPISQDYPPHVYASATNVSLRSAHEAPFSHWGGSLDNSAVRFGHLCENDKRAFAQQFLSHAVFKERPVVIRAEISSLEDWRRLPA